MGAHLRVAGKNHQLQVTMSQPERKEFSQEEAEVAERPQEVSQKETKKRRTEQRMLIRIFNRPHHVPSPAIIKNLLLRPSASCKNASLCGSTAPSLYLGYLVSFQRMASRSSSVALFRFIFSFMRAQ